MFRSDMLIGRRSIVNLQFVECAPNKPAEVVKRNPLLDLIFAPDERGALLGDISHYLGENTNPEVRQFIEQQLLRENNGSSSNMSIPDDVLNKMKSTITDDDIAFFSRDHNETAEQYAYRVGKYFAEEKAKNVANAKFEREKARLESLGIKFD